MHVPAVQEDGRGTQGPVHRARTLRCGLGMPENTFDISDTSNGRALAKVAFHCHARDDGLDVGWRGIVRRRGATCLERVSFQHVAKVGADGVDQRLPYHVDRAN